MLGSIKHALVLAALLLGGCVSYSQHELTPVSTWPPAAQVAEQKPSAFVRTTAMYQVNGGPANAAAGTPAAAWETVVADAYRQSGRFARVSTDKVESDLYAEATLYNNEQFSMASAIITGATFGNAQDTTEHPYAALIAE